jgi:hypothetical protein
MNSQLWVKGIGISFGVPPIQASRDVCCSTANQLMHSQPLSVGACLTLSPSGATEECFHAAIKPAANRIIRDVMSLHAIHLLRCDLFVLQKCKNTIT